MPQKDGQLKNRITYSMFVTRAGKLSKLQSRHETCQENAFLVHVPAWQGKKKNRAFLTEWDEFLRLNSCYVKKIGTTLGAGGFSVFLKDQRNSRRAQGHPG